jgi:predicted RNA-binding protein with PUA-like domain
MRYWLFKSEPSAWSWDDQVARGAEGGPWDGVRNYQARNVMREMAVGDLGFFYHSQGDRAVVGIVEVTAPAAQDPTTDDPRWDCVAVRAREALPRPVTLAEIKARPELAGMALVRQPRLSVQPVEPSAWEAIRAMSRRRG